MTVAPVPAGAAPSCYLAFDYGTRRVGVAVGNSLLRRAQPLKTLAMRGEARFGVELQRRVHGICPRNCSRISAADAASTSAAPSASAAAVV